MAKRGRRSRRRNVGRSRRWRLLRRGRNGRFLSRSRSRRRGRNAWVDDKAGHSLAAKKGWRKRRLRKAAKRSWAARMWAARTGAVPVRRRRAANRGRRYRRHRRNALAGALGRPFSALTSGFNVKNLTDAATIASGMVALPHIKKMVVGALPLGDFFEDERQIGSVVTGIALSGLLGFGVGIINKPIGAKVAFGGVLSEVSRAVNQWVLPLVGLKLTGLDDYLSVSDAAGARSLGYMGDYLSVGDAAGARPLGDMTVGEELAGY